MNPVAGSHDISAAGHNLADRAEFEGAAARILAGRRRFDQQNSFLLLEIGYDLIGADGLVTRTEPQASELALARLVVERVVPTLRGADVVGCLSPDRFAIVPATAQNSREAAALAGRLIETVRGTSLIASNTATWFAVVGIARFPVDGTEVAVLLDAAAAACKRGIQQGANQYRFCSQALHAGRSETIGN